MFTVLAHRVPAIYVSVATGNIHEDVVQAKAAARNRGYHCRDPFHAPEPAGLCAYGAQPLEALMPRRKFPHHARRPR